MTTTSDLVTSAASCQSALVAFEAALADLQVKAKARDSEAMAAGGIASQVYGDHQAQNWVQAVLGACGAQPTMRKIFTLTGTPGKALNQVWA